MKLKNVGFVMTLLGILAVSYGCANSSADEQQKPNIVIIYADDLGYGDLGCYGAKQFETPNIDRIAEEGILFTDGHSGNANCSPSRY